MVKILQRLGLAFGADTNAETAWTQTVYQFDLPRSDEASLDTGLMLMRETAGNLTLDAAALTPERGVVLGGAAARHPAVPRREGPDRPSRSWPTHHPALPHRPGGTLVAHAPVGLIGDFYRANYRPERAALIAVGDFDPAAMEAKITARFSDWKPAGPPTVAPDLGQVVPRGLTTRVVQLPGSSTQTLIAWVRPYDASLDTAAKRRRDTVEDLAIAVLNRRLESLARAPNPPFLAARASSENLLHSDKVAAVEDTSAPLSLAAGAGCGRAGGAASGHLGREGRPSRPAKSPKSARHWPTPRPARRPGRPPPWPTTWSKPWTTIRCSPDPATSPPIRPVPWVSPSTEGRRARRERRFRGRPPGRAGDAHRRGRWGRHPGGRVRHGARRAGERFSRRGQHFVAIRQLRNSRQGGPAQRHRRSGCERPLPNGVGLIVKPTVFRKDQVLVGVSVGAGRLGLPKDHAVAGWAAAALVSGGYKALDMEDAQRVLAGKIFGAKFGLGDQAFELSGATNPKDLATQLQVLAVYLADPGFRPQAFRRTPTRGLSGGPSATRGDARRGGVLGRDLERLLHAGDPRWGFPTREELQAARPGVCRRCCEAPTFGRAGRDHHRRRCDRAEAIDRVARRRPSARCRQDRRRSTPRPMRARSPFPTPTPRRSRWFIAAGPTRPWR